MSAARTQWRYLNAQRELIHMAEPLKYQYALVANQPGGFSNTLGGDDIDPATLRATARVQAWRQPAAGWPLTFQREYLPRKIVQRREKDGRQVYVVGGNSSGVMQLLKSRIVQAAKGNAKADKLGFVTDVMRAYVRDQCTSSAGGDRAFYDTLLVQGDTGEGPVISKEAARAYVLDTLQALVKSAAEPGAYQADVYFDLVPHGAGLLFFVRIGQLGADHGLASPTPTVLLADADLEEWEHEEDGEKEITFAYVGGQGDGETQTIVSVSDATRMMAPPGNRWETWLNVSNQADTKKLQAEGAKALEQGRVLTRLRGTLAAGLYQTRVNFGDRLVVQRGTQLREARADAVTVSGENGAEKVQIRLES